MIIYFFFFFQAEDGIRDIGVTGVQTCALPIFGLARVPARRDGELGGYRRAGGVDQGEPAGGEQIQAAGDRHARADDLVVAGDSGGLTDGKEELRGYGCGKGSCLEEARQGGDQERWNEKETTRALFGHDKLLMVHHLLPLPD